MCTKMGKGGQCPCPSNDHHLLDLYSSQAPVGNFSLRLPRQPWLRSMLQGTLQDWRRKETYMDMHVCGVCMCVCVHAYIHNGSRHTIHLRLGQRVPEKEDSHVSFSNKDPCATFHKGSLAGDCHQGRTGSSDGNPRSSNPDKFST